VIAEDLTRCIYNPEGKYMSELKANNYSLDDGQAIPLNIKKAELKRQTKARVTRYILTLFWQQALQ
jgi:hypothetical protein